MDAPSAGSVTEIVLLYSGYDSESNCEWPIEYIPTIGKHRNVTYIAREKPQSQCDKAVYSFFTPPTPSWSPEVLPPAFPTYTLPSHLYSHLSLAKEILPFPVGSYKWYEYVAIEFLGP